METMHGLTIAFGNKGGASGCQAMHYGGTEWVLSIESMLLALKYLLVSLAQTPQWNHSGG